MNGQEICARCGVPATRWSGVEDWRDEQGRWIGWCSNFCKNAWIDGDRSADHRTHAGEGEVS